ncbi:DUF805 domain-containing protein [Streptomyces sp. TBY4]|uniref:DUF805 domain-containing protein n=1 Tax=Streptomyces sp. TBY4 TaxID=2962030 RepID=UPI0020B805EE|nr:DUF805 domain-containing protein [Streptomyces sp. TBY4]MCP3753765.1 DUF805 domain-containing protein [Streptomyces sp. TBY4]
MHYFTDVVKKYADFSGRARRQEYWMYTLIYIALLIVVLIVDFSLSTYPLLYTLLGLGLFLPSLAVGVRRLHDQGKSGWWILVGFIPLVGWIWAIVLMATEGTPGPNEYGPSPKAVHA